MQRSRHYSGRYEQFSEICALCLQEVSNNKSRSFRGVEKPATLNVKGNTTKLPPKNPTAKAYNPPPLNKPAPILSRGATSTMAHQALHDPARLMERENGRRMSDSGGVPPHIQPLAHKRAPRDSSYH